MGTQCATASELNSGPREGSQSIIDLSLNKTIKNTENMYESIVRLEVRFMSVLPPSLQNSMSKYRIKYEVFYGAAGDRWIEDACDVMYTSKKAFNFDYDITQPEQKVYVKISFDVVKGGNDKIVLSYSKKPAPTPSKEEDGNDEEMGGFSYTINTRFDVHETLMLNGMYGCGDYLTSNIPRDAGEVEDAKGMDKYEQEKGLAKATISEKCKGLKRINFGLTGKFDSEVDHLMVTVYELVGKTRKLIYETLPIEKSESKNNRPGLFYFDKIELNSDVFDSALLATVWLEFELKRVKYSKKKKESYKVLGSETAKLKNILNISERGQLQLSIFKQKKTLRGTINIGNSSLKPVFSFLDYKLNLDINVIPVIAIDYSLSNLTFETSNQLMHSLKKGHENQYISILENILKVYSNLTPFVLGFGMGGKTLPKQQNASSLFALSGNMFHPIVEKDSLIKKYGEVFQKIKVSLPINYCPVMQLVADYARYEKENYEARNFYSLIYITPGVIDDFDLTLSIAKTVGNLPMSVTIVKLFNEQLSDVNDVFRLNNELKEECEKSERNFFNVIDYQKYKDQNKIPLFEEDLIKDIPINVKRYMSMNNVFAYDLDGDDYGTRLSLKHKKTQLLESAGPQFEAELSKRNSMVKVKEYIKELRESSSNLEEEKIEEGKTIGPNVVTPSPKSRNLNTERGNSSEDNHSTWQKDKRRLSFSKVCEAKYISEVPVDDENLKRRVEAITKAGLVFDENRDYLFHLLRADGEQGN